MKPGRRLRLQERRAEAIVRNKARTKHTPQEQLAALDAGGHAAQRERERLHLQIASSLVIPNLKEFSKMQPLDHRTGSVTFLDKPKIKQRRKKAKGKR